MIAARRLARALGLRRWRLQRRRQWAIGLYGGSSPLWLRPLQQKPVLTARQVRDVPATLVADPFLWRHAGGWQLFFEVLNGARGLGEIGLATSSDGRRWRYQQIVLREPFHLSYPYVFSWQGVHYLIPESYQARAVRLYTARAFPYRWEFVAELLSGHPFTDASPVYYRGRWWLFVGTNPPHDDTLRLYSAEALLGPWLEHPASPIVSGNPHLARPAGRIIVDGDQLIRLAQDCHPEYGRLVRAFAVELSPSDYREQPLGELLTPGGRGWRAGGMHHLDAHQLDDGSWLAAVDGWRQVIALI